MGEQNPLESVTEEIGVQKRIPLVQSSEVEICHFCGELIIKLNGWDPDSLLIHHLNGDDTDDRPENLVSTHRGCHSTYHNKEKGKEGYVRKEQWGDVRKEFIKTLADDIICYFCERVVTKLKGCNNESLLIHHINEDEQDNRFENLTPTHRICHTKYHNSGEKNYLYGVTGENHPHYGKHRSEETKKKIGDGNRGKEVSEETREKLRKAGKETAQGVWRKRRERYGPSGFKDTMKEENNPMYGNTEAAKRGWDTRREIYGPTGRRPK